MSRLFRSWVLCGSAVAVLVLLACADEGTVAGGGNRSPNPVYGYIAGSGAGTAVDLYRIDLDYDEKDGYYAWRKVDSTATDADGYFGFDTIGGEPYAISVLARTGDNTGGFAGYYTNDVLEADTVRIPGLVLARTSRVQGRVLFADEVLNRQIIVDGDTLYPFDSLSASVTLVGTPFTDELAGDGAFELAGVPAGTYNLRIRYNSREIPMPDHSILGFYVVHYTTLPVNAPDSVSYADDPYVLADGLAVVGDSVTIVSRLYRVQCRVFAE